ncbi:zinc finger-containing ubiquitin peptidase 1 isoform X1 [Rhodamnia argentea]|uniref:Zinc finger-containing ubiquitin peptidase 1 isoform X1 n=1 Tax=Rhodamnia argentea TaxID=178133 RepID=A0A8B8PYC2_9MYRT|nr:zinc finger-containing ubiquitin peptidase 1 isoform X1 [Rhodamnia argentea]
MDDFSSCPFCSLSVPYGELERHANSHFEDEEAAKDMELARRIAIAPPSPPLTMADQLETDKLKEVICHKAAEVDATRCDGRTPSDVEDEIFHLVSLQTISSFYKIEDGLMALLKRCLELEAEQSTCILCSYLDHFQSTKSEDVGWGCGWRNIQMLGSHLLVERQEAKEGLFGGSGFVPDIVSLQRWLEIAWKRGFDEVGSEHFNQKIYGSSSWIGTTECAALFRSFGLRARIVDFGPKNLESLFLSIPGSRIDSQSAGARGKGNAVHIHGPMDRYLVKRKQISPEVCSSIGYTGCSYIQPDQVLDSSNENLGISSARSSKGQEVLTDWVWRYFSDKSFINNCFSHVSISRKPPLYFQHDGHSRTIVGIQVIHQPKGMQKYNLLVLDPAHRTAMLERSLKRNAGWQKLIKRGVHTLKKPQYQLCYIDPGIAKGEELEQLKTVDSVYIEI